MTLYSYCLRYDDGAAPNPYWGVCTLVICKPAIRRVAQKGDWIVGLGSVHSPVGDISSSVVYAMKVTKVLSLQQYDQHCKRELPEKIPDWTNADFRRRVGDCIYDYAEPGKPKLRLSVHDEGNRLTDLGGKNAILSTQFYYFGAKPIPLPRNLYPIIHRTQGHKSHANTDHMEPFIQWIQGSGLESNRLYGDPQLKSQIMEMADCRGACARRDHEDDDKDEVC